MSGGAPKGTLNVERRTWDREAAVERLKKRIEQQESRLDAPVGPVRNREEFQKANEGAAGPAGSQRAFIKAREGDLRLDENLGKSRIISASAPINRQAVWFCDVCQCELRDSVSYVDHINGRKHLRALGFSQRTERATLDSVQERLAKHRQQKLEEEKTLSKRKRMSHEEIEEDQIREYEEKLEEEERLKRQQRLKRKQEKKRRKLEEQRKAEEREAPKAAEEPVAEEHPEGDKPEGTAEEDDSGMDPAMLAMMGFGGFGSSKK
mmetsp:Transcript_16424/g.62395  ORF Transcript_16424/g.62395 Transcript_16424/m.62395 type:complete len:264 (-) Transcript_16424:2298-3089(-)|eukprot:scaffold3350_cov268-Pinguiococcus_pyrenoidosus.AAC.3